MLTIIKPNNKSVYVKIFVCLLVLSSLCSAFAYDTRLISMGNPTLSLNAAASAAGYNSEATPTTTYLRFPGDEFGLGLSAIPDTLDIWKLPARLADEDLFPGNTAIIDFGPGSTGNGGLVIAPRDFPVCFGLFFLRPTLTGWVIGEARDVAASNVVEIETFYEDATGATLPAAPLAPNNLVDLFLGLKLGHILIGAGAGFSYDLAADSITESLGVTTTQNSYSFIVTLRGGATIKLDQPFPFDIDLGVTVPIGKSSASTKANDNSEDDSLTATNVALSTSMRLSAGFVPDLDVFLLGVFSLLPQNFEATDNGAAIDTATAMVDDSRIISFGVGTGVNWQTTENLLVNATGTFVFSNFTFTAEDPGISPRSEDARSWMTARIVIAMEYALVPEKFTIRGGINSYMAWPHSADNVTGADAENVSFNAGAGAAAGLTFQPVEALAMDFALNIANFADSTSFRTLSTQMTTTLRF